MRIKTNNLKRVELCAEDAKKLFPVLFLRKLGNSSLIVCNILAPKEPKFFQPSGLRGGGGEMGPVQGG